jgi:hypothetical protein
MSFKGPIQTFYLPRARALASQFDDGNLHRRISREKSTMPSCLHRPSISPSARQHTVARCSIDGRTVCFQLSCIGQRPCRRVGKPRKARHQARQRTTPGRLRLSKHSGTPARLTRLPPASSSSPSQVLIHPAQERHPTARSETACAPPCQAHSTSSAKYMRSAATNRTIAVMPGPCSSNQKVLNGTLEGHLSRHTHPHPRGHQYHRLACLCKCHGGALQGRRRDGLLHVQRRRCPCCP